MVGDYLLQTDHQAKEKTSRWWPAVLHGLTYTIPFIFIVHSIPALLVISTTHMVIDRYRLAKYVIWAKNQIAPKRFRPTKEDMLVTGYAKSTPDWMAVWLLIIADNTIHIIFNTLAIVYLGGIISW